jgi:hypothetical protein
LCAKANFLLGLGLHFILCIAPSAQKILLRKLLPRCLLVQDLLQALPHGLLASWHLFVDRIKFRLAASMPRVSIRKFTFILRKIATLAIN